MIVKKRMLDLIFFFVVSGAVDGCDKSHLDRLIDDVIGDGQYADIFVMRNFTKPVQVTVGLGIYGGLSLLWVSPTLQWDPLEYGNITTVYVPQSYVWKPDMVLVNTQEKDMYVGSTEVFIRIDSTGLVDWQPPFLSSFTCLVDVTKFPMDENICKVEIGPWTQSNTYVKLTLMAPPILLDKVAKGRNAMYYIERDETIFLQHHEDGEVFEYFSFHIKFSRRPQYTMLSLFLPVMVIGLLNPLTFLIPPNIDQKVGASLSVLLSTAVCTNSLRDDLPDKSDPLSSIVIFVVVTLVSAFLGVLGNIIVLLCHRSDARRNLRSLPDTSSTAPDKYKTYTGVDRTTNPREQGHESENYPEKPVSEDTNSQGDGVGEISKAEKQSVASGRSCLLSKRLNWIFFAITILLYVLNLMLVLFEIFC